MLKRNNLEVLFDRKIPEIETLNMWEEHEFIDSPFVEIPDIVKIGKETKIIVDLQYPKFGMQNAIKKCLIRKEVLERLLIACTFNDFMSELKEQKSDIATKLKSYSWGYSDDCER